MHVCTHTQTQKVREGRLECPGNKENSIHMKALDISLGKYEISTLIWKLKTDKHVLKQSQFCN